MKILYIPFYICYYIQWFFNNLIAKTQENIMLKFTKTDSASELEGTWTDYDDGNGGVLKLLIARSDGNPHYESTLTRLMAPYRKKMERGKTIENSVAKRVITQVLAKEILLNWDHTVLLDDEGQEVKYSEDNAVELLTNDNDLRDFVAEFSGDQSNFLKKQK